MKSSCLARRWLAALALIFALGAPPPVALAVNEDDVKLVLLYKIARFVDWPSENKSLRLCVAGEQTFSAARKRLAGRKVRGRPLDVLPFSASSRPGDCEALYVAADNLATVSPLLDALSAASVLTVSDAPGFAQRGGVVGLSRQGKRIGVTINIEASQRAGLEISSQLLELATLVGDGQAGRP